MNREIKFRIWNELKMDYFTLDNDFDCQSGWLVNGKLTQFIGMQDKKGNDIYEGDVLINNGKKIGIVEYLEGKFCLKIMKTHCVEYDILSVGFLKNKEIIGNIFENPEFKELD